MCHTGGQSLRGGASHEAKGRRGARAGRVRAPAGRPRLLRQIRDELVPGVEQFLLVDEVVAVEDGAALVPDQEHGDALGHAGAGQVAGGGAAAIVEEAGLSGPRRARRRARASAIRCDMGSLRPTNVFERAGESRMTPPASSISSQVRLRISFLRQPQWTAKPATRLAYLHEAYPPHLHTLAALIAAHPDRTLAERKDALATPARVPTVWRAVRALGLTVNKHGPPVRTRST